MERPYPGNCARDGKRQGPYHVLIFDFSASVESTTQRSLLEKKDEVVSKRHKINLLLL